MVRASQDLVKRGNVDEARAHLLKAAQWEIPALAERARKDAEGLSVAAVAKAEKKAETPEPAPASKPDPVPEPEKKEPAPAPVPAPAPTPAKQDPAPAAKTETKADGPGVTTASRPPRKGPYQPGGLTDEEKSKKQSELGAAAKKEKQGAKKVAAR